MSTIAGKRAATVAPLGRVVRCCFVLLLCAGLGLAIPYAARPCQAQSAPAQNATPPPPPPDDPPPSLIHHPKPTPAPAQTNTTPAPAPAQQTPATQSDATKGAEPPADSAAAQPATQDPAAASSTRPQHRLPVRSPRRQPHLPTRFRPLHHPPRHQHPRRSQLRLHRLRLLPLRQSLHPRLTRRRSTRALRRRRWNRAQTWCRCAWWFMILPATQWKISRRTISNSNRTANCSSLRIFPW